MSEPVVLVWNGWGLLFTGFVAAWQFLHILVTVKFGSGTPLRGALALMGVGAVVLAVVLSGWVAGLLALPIGMSLGVILARLLIPRPS
jgi:hypothetical protein